MSEQREEMVMEDVLNRYVEVDIPREKKRLAAIAMQTPDGKVLLRELVGTVFPFILGIAQQAVRDRVAIVDVISEIESRVGGGESESQLQPEDAQLLRECLQAHLLIIQELQQGRVPQDGAKLAELATKAEQALEIVDDIALVEEGDEEDGGGDDANEVS